MNPALLLVALPVKTKLSDVQAVQQLLNELAHEEKVPRRLVAASQSMFQTAAGSRYKEDYLKQEHLRNTMLSSLLLTSRCHDRQSASVAGTWTAL